ncbi:WHG domain-containing protein [Paenibacillus sp. ACRRX]|uniref:TetR/AcrR family transcriptional regulator n=1 Tax=Paenibacillus sp. ACRRX TaxID=2918206 RepID=UPI001EF4B112|nr:TetR/AcrR family transcriptional regulator [Paenibacillus sp. ACRRX]MCG7409697.1 WHG domain-containing protein [Paenibacillus sp. ACRRX]
MRQGLDQFTVLQAAAELADAHGYEQLSLASLAKQLQIRTPSLYNHVKGMPGLKQALASYAVRKLKEALIEGIIGKSGDEALHALAFAYVDFVRQHPGIYEASMGAPDPLDPDFQTAGTEVVQLIIRLMESYQLEPEVAIHAVRGMRSIVHGFASLELRKEFNIEISKNESLHYAITAYLRGVQHVSQNPD